MSIQGTLGRIAPVFFGGFVLVGYYLSMNMKPFYFKDRVVDLNELPPAPIAWLTNIIDSACMLLPCADWRETLEIPKDSWLSHKVPGLIVARPPLLTYKEFMQQQPEGASPFSPRLLYKYALTPSTALGDLGTPTSCLMLFLLLVLIRRLKKVLLPAFSAMGREAGRRTHGADWEKDNEVRIVKFGEYVYRLLFHSAISIYGIYYFRDMEWWQRDGFRFIGTRSLFSGFPSFSIDARIAWYYLVQCAYNLDAMISLLEISFKVGFRSPFAASATHKGPARRKYWQSPIHIRWSEDVRGDFSEMFIHHVATNILVIGSSICRLTRSGSMVFLIHDISDVPVDLSKLANFLKWKITTVVFFAIMTITWLITRLYILPFVLFAAVVMESHYILEEGLDPMLYVCYRHLFYALLSTLILLHLSWFMMFIRMFLTLVMKNECHDYSEHKNGEKVHGTIAIKKEEEKRKKFN